MSSRRVYLKQYKKSNNDNNDTGKEKDAGPLGGD